MYRGKHLSVLLIVVAVVLMGSMLQGCYTSGQYNRLKEQLANANETIDLKEMEIEELDHALIVKREECLAMKDQAGDVDKYRKNSEEAEKLINELKAKLTEQKSQVSKATNNNNPEGVTFWVPKGDNVGIRLNDLVMFDSGSTNIKTGGKQVLDIIANDLKSRGKRIKIEGHTDNDPVVKTKDKYKKGNIELSTKRALAVWQYFKDRGVPEKQMCVAGFGPTKPISPNSTDQGKQRNRRVEIILSD